MRDAHILQGLGDERHAANVLAREQQIARRRLSEPSMSGPGAAVAASAAASAPFNPAAERAALAQERRRSIRAQGATSGGASKLLQKAGDGGGGGTSVIMKMMKEVGEIRWGVQYVKLIAPPLLVLFKFHLQILAGVIDFAKYPVKILEKLIEYTGGVSGSGGATKAAGGGGASAAMGKQAGKVRGDAKKIGGEGKKSFGISVKREEITLTPLGWMVVIVLDVFIITNLLILCMPFIIAALIAVLGVTAICGGLGDICTDALGAIIDAI